VRGPMSERPRRSLLLTFDYELFLGPRSGSVERCLLRPTKEILDVLRRHSCRAVFFVDCTYLARLAEASAAHAPAAEDLARVCEQLRAASAEGHELFYHLHPNWLDAVYRPATNDWDLSNASRFTLEGLDEDTLARVFASARAHLLPLRATPGLPSGFRAGGLFIEPFARVRPHLLSAGVGYDFSVLPGFVGEGPGFRLDHREVPRRVVYRFSDTVLSERVDGEFTELTLSRLTIGTASRIINGVLHRVLARFSGAARWGDGESSSVRLAAPPAPRGLAQQETLSVELLNPVKAALYLSFLKTQGYVHTISHPKLCSALNVRCFDWFLSRARQRFDLETDFRRFPEVAT
jgi:hypothetical protein